MAVGDCGALSELGPRQALAVGGVKRMDIVSTGGFNLTLSTAIVPALSDFNDGIRALLDLNGRPGSRAVVPLFGYCRDTQQMLTPYYPLGSADHLDQLLAGKQMARADELRVRVRAIEAYLDALVVLHGHTSADARPRVLCDAREGPTKLLSQFLVATLEGQIVLNDVDAAPAVDSSCPTPTGAPGVKCGHRQFLETDFVAPEMLWPHKTRAFSDEDMPCYTEKIDIWRVPKTVAHLFSDVIDHVVTTPSMDIVFRRRMDALKRDCTVRDPLLRPSALEVRQRFHDLAISLLVNLDDEDPDFPTSN